METLERMKLPWGMQVRDPERARAMYYGRKLQASMLNIAVSLAPGDNVPSILPVPVTAGAITAATAKQNLQGYNCLVTVGIVTTTATAATILAGVGTTAALAATNEVTVINTFTLASVNWNQISIPVPAGYFWIVAT